MISMKTALYWLLLSLPLIDSCPFANNWSGPPPKDAIHQHSSLRRRLTALSENPETKAKLDAIIGNRAAKQRSLQIGTCVSEQTYDAIDEDVAALSETFVDNISRAHFLGGVVRLAAHDFMDFDRFDVDDQMGSDGCIDVDHPANSGLPEDIWCTSCDLTIVYESNYSYMSKADFWVAAANAIIRQASGNELDLKGSFVYGRKDATSCIGSADRLPSAGSCTEVEDVFLNRMGLTWTDAVALLGGHTIGRGSEHFSGHDGIWVDTEEESVIFDKKYYEEILRRAWIPRNTNDPDIQDWTWGGRNDDSPRFMLNADLCLVFDIETTFPCCTKTDLLRTDGENQCDGRNGVLSNVPCGKYAPGSPREEAANAVNLFAQPRDPGRPGFFDDNGPFFDAFASAWTKATANGWTGLQPLATTCESPSPTVNPTGVPSSALTDGPTDHSTTPPTQRSSGAPTTPKPTSSPTKPPTDHPTTSSSTSPSEVPTAPKTTFSPTKASSDQPTIPPSEAPTTLEPSVNPSEAPTNRPTTSPTKSLSDAPTTFLKPTSTPTQNPTNSPATPPPTLSCQDEPSFIHRGRMRNCAWVISRGGRCQKFERQCPASCGGCK